MAYVRTTLEWLATSFEKDPVQTVRFILRLHVEERAEELVDVFDGLLRIGFRSRRVISVRIGLFSYSSLL